MKRWNSGFFMLYKQKNKIKYTTNTFVKFLSFSNYCYIKIKWRNVGNRKISYVCLCSKQLRPYTVIILTIISEQKICLENCNLNLEWERMHVRPDILIEDFITHVGTAWCLRA